jgi:hypothetical protein
MLSIQSVGLGYSRPAAGLMDRPPLFHTVLKTVTLDVFQWLICTAVALSIVAAAEIRKAVLRRTAAAPGMLVSR